MVKKKHFMQKPFQDTHLYRFICKIFDSYKPGQWIRIIIVSIVGYYIFDYGLKWTLASQQVLKIYAAYNSIQLANTTNNSMLVNNTEMIFTNSMLHEPVFFIFISGICWFALIKWFVLPEKVLDIEKIRRLWNETEHDDNRSEN